MSLAENLLNSLDETAYQNSRMAGIQPEEEHIIVGQDRVITVPNVLKIIAVKGDKDIETATIDCVRYWDGHDLSSFAIYLNYILPNGDEGTYIPKSITKSDDFFSFDWEIGSEFTYAQGKLTFWIVTKLTDDNGELVKQWSSFQNSDCTIAQGGDKIYVPEKQTDQDVISQAISISRASAETAEQQANLAKEAAEKAATDAREAAEDEVSRIIGELGVVQELGDSPNSVVSQLKVTKEFNKTNAKINRNSKRITNLEQGLPSEQFMTDSTVAYTKDVPSNALPYAEIAKIGGMTYKCTVAEGEDGYFTGLRSAKVTEVKSVGVNLIPLQEGYTVTQNGVTFKVNDDKSITLNGDATGDLWCALGKMYLTVGEQYTFVAKNCPKEILACYAYNDADIWAVRDTAITKIAKEERYVFVLGGGAGATFNNLTIYPMLNKGTTAEPYTPYVEHILPIPEAVRPANGINENVYDFIEWAEDGSAKKTVKCGVVDLGTLNWGYTYEHLRFHAQLPTDIVNKTYNEEHSVCSLKYNDTVYYDTHRTNGYCISKGEMLVRNSAYTDAKTFKAAMSSVMLVYELAEPEVTDISDLITADNLIGVEGGGVITFENEYSYDVPSEVEYQLEV